MCFFPHFIAEINKSSFAIRTKVSSALLCSKSSLLRLGQAQEAGWESLVFLTALSFGGQKLLKQAREQQPFIYTRSGLIVASFL